MLVLQNYVHFLASSLLKSRYVMTPELLQMEMAATQTMDCRLVSTITYARRKLLRTDLNSQEKEVEVEVDAREDVFVGRRHQNGRDAV